MPHAIHHKGATMNRRAMTTILPTIACLLSALAAVPAQADMKLSMHMSMSGPQMPQMQNMPPQARAMMDRMMQTTTYMSGKRARVDTAMMSIITDPPADKMIMINNFARTYSVTKLDAAKASKMMAGSGPGRMGANG